MGTTDRQQSHTTDRANYLEQASEALLAGLTREGVIAQLIGRIRRDQGYLAYRRASGRRTRYDEQVTSGLRAIALAVCWLEEAPGDSAMWGARVRRGTLGAPPGGWGTGR